MRKILVLLVISSCLLGACSPQPENSAASEEPALKLATFPKEKQRDLSPTLTPVAAPAPSATPSPAPQLTPVATPEPNAALPPAPQGYVSREYYSIQLPESMAEWSEIYWREQDYDPKLTYEIFIPAILNIDRLPEAIIENVETDGSYDVFVITPENFGSMYEKYGLIAISLISLGNPVKYTFQDYLDGFEYDPKIIREGSFTTAEGITGSGGILEHGDENSRYRAGFLGFEAEGHAYYIMFITSASSFDQLESPISSVIKSLEFYSNGEAQRPYAARAAPTALNLTGFEPQPYDLDPAMQMSSADEYAGAIYAGLVRLSPQLEVVPDLAEKWVISDDGTIYTFTLRAGLAFENGKPITSEDIRYSWERAADPDLGSLTARTYLGDIQGLKDKLDGNADQISGVEVLDERTLRLTLEQPTPDFLMKLSYPTSFVVDRGAVETGDWYQPNASGPYTIFDSLDYGLVLKRNEAYHSRAIIDTIEYTYEDNLAPGLLYEYFDYGDIDAAIVLDVELIVELLDPTHPGHENLVVGSDQCTTLLDMNPSLPPFDDINVRKAFALAIDRQRLNEELYGGLGLPAFTILPPGMPGYLEALHRQQAEQAVHDPDTAARDLSLSPYAGDLPEISLLNYSYEYTASVIEAMLEETLGVSVRVYESYYSELEDEEISRGYHLLMRDWCADYPDPANFLDILYSGSTGYNGFDLQDALLRDLVAQARSELEPDRRMELYQEIERRLLQEFLAVPLLHSRSYFLVSSSVDGFVYPGIGVRYLDQLSEER